MVMIFLPGIVDFLQRAVKRGGLTAAGGPGDQDHAMGLQDHLVETRQLLRRKAHSLQLGKNLPALEQANDHAFAVQRRHRGDTQIDILAAQSGLDATVLRQAALGDIELGENF